MFLGNDTILEAAYSHGVKQDLLFSGFRVFSDHPSLGLKHFFGNSFYLTTALAMRKFGFVAEGFLLNDDSYTTIRHTVSSAGVDVVIGNQWQWNHMTIGCDWIGIFNSVGRIKESGSDSAWISDPTYQEVNEKFDNEIAKSSSGHSLRFYFGFTL